MIRGERRLPLGTAVTDFSSLGAEKTTIFIIGAKSWWTSPPAVRISHGIPAAEELSALDMVGSPLFTSA